MAETRPLREGERALAARALGVRERAFEVGLRAVVHGDGPAAGVAAYTISGDGTTGALGAIALPAGALMRDMYELIGGVARELLAAGCTRGRAVVMDGALVRVLSATFDVGVEPFGRDAAGALVMWRFDVDLADVLVQLDERASGGR
jgi:hypothetical protein